MLELLQQRRLSHSLAGTSSGPPAATSWRHCPNAASSVGCRHTVVHRTKSSDQQKVQQTHQDPPVRMLHARLHAAPRSRSCVSIMPAISTHAGDLIQPCSRLIGDKERGSVASWAVADTAPVAAQAEYDDTFTQGQEVDKRSTIAKPGARRALVISRSQNGNGSKHVRDTLVHGMASGPFSEGSQHAQSLQQQQQQPVREVPKRITSASASPAAAAMPARASPPSFAGAPAESMSGQRKDPGFKHPKYQGQKRKPRVMRTEPTADTLEGLVVPVVAAALRAGALTVEDVLTDQAGSAMAGRSSQAAGTLSVPGWQLDALMTDSIEALFNHIKVREQQTNIAATEAWLYVHQLGQLLDGLRKKAHQPAMQQAAAAVQGQQGHRHIPGTGTADDPYGAGWLSVEDRTRAIRILQAFTPLLLWSSRAGPARCCLLLRAMTGVGYTGPDDMRLLAEDSLNSLEQYTPQQVASVVLDFTRLGYKPSQGWMLTLFKVTLTRMHRYNAPALADLAYALAKWGEKQVNPRWLAAYFSRWQELLSTAHAYDKPGAGSAGSASSVSNQAGQDAGGALLGVPDDQGSSAGALGMAGSQQRMVSNGEQRGEVMGGATWAGARAAGLNARVVDQALWSWAELRWPVPHSVLHRMAFEVQVLMPDMYMSSLAACTWALAILNYSPPLHWIQELEHASSERWPECTKHGMEVCNLLWAMAAWQYTPSRTWLGAALMQAARLLPSLSPGGLASLLLSLADLDFTPPTDWASAALEQVHMRVVRDRRPAQRHELVAVLWAVSRFVRPNGALRTAQAAAAVGMAGSLAALGQLPEAVVGRPERKWMLRYRPVLQDLCDLMQAQLQLLSPEQLLDVAVALADLTYYPGDDFMAAHEVAMRPGLYRLSTMQRRLLVRAYETLDGIWEGYYIPRKGERY